MTNNVRLNPDNFNKDNRRSRGINVILHEKCKPSSTPLSLVDLGRSWVATRPKVDLCEQIEW
jgi:hypothetical protein